MRLLVDLLPWKCSFHIARYCSLCKSLCEDVLWGPARFAGGGSWFQCICSLDKLSFLFSSIEAVKPDRLSDGLSKYASLLGFLLLEPFTKFYLSMSSLDGWCSGWCTGVVSLSGRSVYWGSLLGPGVVSGVGSWMSSLGSSPSSFSSSSPSSSSGWNWVRSPSYVGISTVSYWRGVVSTSGNGVFGSYLEFSSKSTSRDSTMYFSFLQKPDFEIFIDLTMAWYPTRYSTLGLETIFLFLLILVTLLYTLQP